MNRPKTLVRYLLGRQDERQETGSESEKELADDPNETGPGAALHPGTGPVVWFHTGMDRHGISARELAKRMAGERDDLVFLFTTSAPEAIPHEPPVYSLPAPKDTRAAVRRFLDRWRPSVAIWTETDLRSTLIQDADARQIPLYYIDAFTGAPDTKGWRWIRGMSGALLRRFRLVLTGNQERAYELVRLGADPKRVEVAGFLEEGSPALHCNELEFDAFASVLAGRPVWLSAYTMPGEMPYVLAAHSQAERQSHRLLLILVPAEPLEGAAMRDEAIARGFTVALRSEGAEPGPDTQVYIADTTDEMGLWYRLAPVSFIGKSLEPGGGANPFEAAALGSAIIHGPNVRNFRRAYAKLGAAGASRLVRGTGGLSEAVETLLSPDKAATMAHEAWKVCSSGAEITDRVRDLVFTVVDEMEEI